MADLKLKSINKTYKNGVRALTGFDLYVRNGEFIVLAGPSGCGKTTLLRIIAGLEEASSGDILIDNQKVNHLHPRDRNISMVFQNYTLFPYMSVFKNIAFALKLSKEPAPVIEEKVHQVSKMLSIQHLLSRKPKELSGGEKQRVALGRAIIRQPQLFLFDEPLSNLDANLRASMRREIATIHKMLRTTIIYVTHDQVEAMTLGERIVIMKDGLIQQVGRPVEVYNNPESFFVAKFTGTINSLTGRMIMKGNKIVFHHEYQSDTSPLFSIEKKQACAKMLPYIDKKVILAVRPEDIYIGSRSSLISNTREAITLEAVNQLTEHQGHISYSTFKLINGNGNNNLIVRLSNDQNINIGESVRLKLNIEKLHLFPL